MIISIITAFLIVVLVAVSVIFGLYDDEYCACGDGGHPHPYDNTCSVCGRYR